LRFFWQNPNAYIPLSELADISLDTGASFIYREGSQRYIPIKFSVRGRDLGGTVAEAQERVAKVKLPNGYQILWAGEFDDLQNAKKRLMVVIPITLLLILVLLYGATGTFRVFSRIAGRSIRFDCDKRRRPLARCPVAMGDVRPGGRGREGRQSSLRASRRHSWRQLSVLPQRSLLW
jgi:hypothetical protein